MKIAVMMAAHNAARHIEDALASLLRQRDAARLDIIVVNDGSTDGTGEIVRRIAAEAPEVRLIETPNQGIARTRNVLLDALAPDTDLVTSLDSDDLSPSGRFARDVKHFVDDTDLEFHYGFARMFRDVGPDRLSPDPAGRFADIRGVQLGAALLRYSLSRRIGRFDETLVQAEDSDFLFRTLELQPRMTLSGDICVYYRRHDRNTTRDLLTARKDFAKVLIRYTRRRRAGGAAIPAGFFDGGAALEGIDWW